MFLPLYDLNPHRRTPLVTVALIVTNVAALIWLMRLPSDRQAVAPFQYGFVPARISQLRTERPLVIDLEAMADERHLPMVGQVPGKIHFEARPLAVLSSLLTCMFLHGGWMHLVGNMWFLWIFGNNVEDRLGHVWYLLFYLAGGLLASACHWATNPESVVPVIGASGAVAAILGAYAVTWPTAKVRTLVFLAIFITTVDLPALALLGLWFAMQLFEAGLTLKIGIGVGGGVAWWAHVGGFLAGVLLMPLLFGQWGRRHRGDAWALVDQSPALELPQTPSVWASYADRQEPSSPRRRGMF